MECPDTIENLSFSDFLSSVVLSVKERYYSVPVLQSSTVLLWSNADVHLCVGEKAEQRNCIPVPNRVRSREQIDLAFPIFQNIGRPGYEATICVQQIELTSQVSAAL